jgi:hypothetical protein
MRRPRRKLHPVVENRADGVRGLPNKDEGKADVFDYIERLYNPKRRGPTIGYLSPMESSKGGTSLSPYQQAKVQINAQVSLVNT